MDDRTADCDTPDPAMTAALRTLMPAGADASTEPMTLAERRALLDAREQAPLDADLHYEPVDIDGVAADWVWADTSDTARTVLYAHGGGFVTGSSATSRVPNARVARASRTRFLSVNYALAPERPFPAGLHDVLNCYRWLLDQGHRAEHIAFSGTSAGGTLVLAALHRARAMDLPFPAAVAVMNPLTDFTTFGSEHPDQASRAGFVDQYLAGHDPADPAASPALGELGDLPPVHLEVGRADPPFLRDNRAFAAAAQAAGVAVDFHEIPGGTHSFVYLDPDLPQSQQFVDRTAGFLAAHLF
jgi:acetyl esterase/lipase